MRMAKGFMLNDYVEGSAGCLSLYSGGGGHAA